VLGSASTAWSHSSRDAEKAALAALATSSSFILGNLTYLFCEESSMNDNLHIKVRSVIAEHLGIDAKRLTDEARFRDLGADWLDRLELMIAIEDQVAGFEIDDVVVDQIDTIGDLIRVIESVDNNRSHAMLIGGTAQR
jgi:acyl carrier protein